MLPAEKLLAVLCLVIISIFALFPVLCEAAPERDADGLTALHKAAGKGDVKAVQDLLDHGADLYTLDSKAGVSVLHKAVYSGKADTVELLLNRGALINLQSPSNGDTPLHDAIYFKRGNDMSVVKVLLDHGANQNVKNRDGLVAIESARILKDADAEKMLQDYATKRQSESSRALMAAVRANNLNKVEAILKGEKVNLQETDEQGFAPLAWAAREGYTPLVKVLLEKGANPNQLDEWMGATAGHKAAFWGRPEAMKLLISHGLDLNARGAYNGYTALMDAVTRNHVALAKLLVEAGANLDIRGHDDLSALNIASMNGNEELVNLLKHKASKTDIENTEH